MYPAIPFPTIQIFWQKHQLLLFLWLLLAPTCNTWAQKGMLDFGIHTGVAMTRLYEVQKTKNDFYFRTVPETGLQLSYGIGHRLSLGTELNYTRISTQQDGLLSTCTAARQVYTGTERLDLDYIEIPMLISGHIGCRLKLFCGIGPFIGFRLNARRSISRAASGNYTGYIFDAGTTRPGAEESSNITNDIRMINIGGCERMGLSYPLAKGRIWLEARYNFGQVDIWKKGRSMAANQTDQLVLRIAYTVSL